MAYIAPVVVASGHDVRTVPGGRSVRSPRAADHRPGRDAGPDRGRDRVANGGGASGGLLAAGTYYFVVTETNGFGETTAGPVSAG